MSRHLPNWSKWRFYLTGWFFAYPRFRTSLSLSDLHTHVKALHNFTPFDLQAQVAILLECTFQKNFDTHENSRAGVT